MTSLVLYSTIGGNFYTHNEGLEKAIDTAKTRVGDDTWKKGYSAAEPDGATVAIRAELKQAGIQPVEVEGVLTNVSFVENKDASGNTYPKLRVDVEKEDDKLVLSLDLKSDVAQRLLSKLDNCNPGDRVKISAWPSPVTKGDRTFINHAVSMKDNQGVEVPVNSNFSSHLKQQSDGIEASLKSAGIDDKKVINNAKTSKRIQEHKDLLLQIEERFKKPQ